MTFSLLAADVLICLDFEATCDDEGAVSLETQEIIEFPVVVLDVQSRKVLLEHRRYVRPVSSPVTPFCTQLTGIEEATLVSEGCSLAEAVADVEARLAAIPAVVAAAKRGRVVAVAHGPWDLGMQLPREAAKKQVELPAYFERYFDVKRLFAMHRQLRPQDFEAHDVVSPTLINICAALGREAQGRLHCGLDDARSVVEICLAWLERADGLAEQLFVDASLDNPTQCLKAADAAEQRFSRNGSDEDRCVGVFITGLPFLAHGELVSAWLAGILDGRRGLEANRGALAGSGSPLLPSELWLRVDATSGLPSGDAVAVWEDPTVALACVRQLCFGQEIQVECLANDGEEQLIVRQLRASPQTLKELTALARDRHSVPFPPSEDLLDALRSGGLDVCAGDWFCLQCLQHNADEAVACSICGAPPARLPLLSSLRNETAQALPVPRPSAGGLHEGGGDRSGQRDCHGNHNEKVCGSGGSKLAEPAVRQPEKWEKYIQPRTERVWFWNPATEETFYAIAAGACGWEQFIDSAGKPWWWQDSTGRFFYEEA